ncbi:hypothetical protein GTR02_08515 [Kineococcus sp. R8]|uniref:hypothetical protein n=1 Tax=Kineococcus siccus TaxID=2696567 RepID=UPI001412C259|nr:hypothetical protein [Kineococcus siccus]NAZ81862.1 hypothetical protein [Kineococcus siccus]
MPPPEAPIDDPGEEQLSAPRRALRAVPPPEPPAPPVEEDVPSRDDEDAEDAQLVGTAVVEQILGGRVISADGER